MRPRRPFRVGPHSVEGANALRDADTVSDLVAALEPDQKGMPVLLRQYLKMGGKVLAFNVDRRNQQKPTGLSARIEEGRG